MYKYYLYERTFGVLFAFPGVRSATYTTSGYPTDCKPTGHCWTMERVGNAFLLFSGYKPAGSVCKQKLSKFPMGATMLFFLGTAVSTNTTDGAEGDQEMLRTMPVLPRSIIFLSSSSFEFHTFYRINVAWVSLLARSYEVGRCRWTMRKARWVHLARWKPCSTAVDNRQLCKGIESRFVYLVQACSFQMFVLQVT